MAESRRENPVSRVIVEAAMEVHRVLGGPGLLESVYETCPLSEAPDEFDNLVKLDVDIFLDMSVSRIGGRMRLPGFTEEGLLPPGDYELTLLELRESLLVVGPSVGYPNWDSAWRARLLDNLEILVRQLWQVGVREIFIDGSFVEDKDHPNDIDGYFVCELMELASGELQQKLNAFDPNKVWTWDPASRRPHRGYPKKQLPMWHQYRVELYPHFGQGSGIRDRHGNELEFPAAFRMSRRDGRSRGIVKIGGAP